MEASVPPHDFALIPTDFRNIVLSVLTAVLAEHAKRLSLVERGDVSNNVLALFECRGRSFKFRLFTANVTGKLVAIWCKININPLPAVR